MDPYQQALLDRLGEADPIEVLNATPARLLEVAERLNPDDWTLPLSPGGWSAAEVVAHLADVELAMGFRLRQAVAGQTAVQPFDQDAWARRYRRLEPTLALEMLRAARAWNLALFATFDLDDWLTDLEHPERGSESVDMVVRSLAGHDLRHLDRLVGLLAG
jgi:uncharacterized damage-inducible protein DinB